MKTVLTAFIAFVIGATGGYFIADTSCPRPEPESGTMRLPRRKTIDVKDDAAEKALRARIRNLEERLAGSAGKTGRSPDEGEAARGRAHEPFDFRERMEKMKEENPQRYQEITNRIARFRMQRAKQAASKMEFLSSIDVSGMSAGARRTHEELQMAIARREELEAKMHEADLSDEERMGLFMQMRETDGDLRRLNAAERDNLLLETAKSLGFDGADAKEISSTVKEIIDATSSWHHMPGGGRSRHGRGGR